MELLSYDFVLRGLVAGLAIAISSALVGVFLILRRMAFLGAGLSHAAFGGIALSLVFGLEPFLFTAIFTILTGNLIQFLTTKRRVPGDAAIALIFSGGVALAVLVLGIVKGFGEYIFGYLFGNILMVTSAELIFSLITLLFVVLFFFLFYRKLVLVSFSEEIAKLRDVNLTLINHLLVSAASLVIVLSIKAVGIVLASSMIVIPALTSLLLARSFLCAVVISVLVAASSVIGGIIIALYSDLPPSGTIVGGMIVLFALAFLRKSLRA